MLVHDKIGDTQKIARPQTQNSQEKGGTFLEKTAWRGETKGFAWAEEKCMMDEDELA